MTKEDREYYGEYAEILRERERWLVGNLKKILDDVSMDSEKRPAEHILSRIKSAKSLQEKLKIKGKNTGFDEAMESIGDMIGVRIVVHFVGDVYEILKRIEESPLWKVTEVKDYISSPKKNGYRSLHVICEIPFSGKGYETMRAEIQMRTIAMDCWASLEHQLKYKKSIKDTGLIEGELKKCAAQIASVDLTLQSIRDLLL